MPVYLICLLIIIGMIPVGLLLRYAAEKTLGRGFNWVQEGKEAMVLVGKKNVFLWLLLALEGIISNFALLGFIVGIPLYFWKGI